MSTAEKLLQEAQYAFHSITFGESRGNTRNRRRASSLSRKIIRKYPGSMEAGQAHAILRRLGEEAYISNMGTRHRHITQQQHHEPDKVVAARTFVTDPDVEDVALDWTGLISTIAALPRILIGFLVVGGFFLFSLIGPFLLLPLVALVLFIGPLRSTLSADKQRQLNDNIRRINLFIGEQKR